VPPSSRAPSLQESLFNIYVMTNVVVQDTLARVRARIGVLHKVRARHSGWRHVATFPCGLRHNVWPFIRGRLARVYAYPRATLPITLHWRCCPQAVESIALLDLLCCFTAYVLTTPAGQALGEEAEER
jgi:hypothetical protein